MIMEEEKTKTPHELADDRVKIADNYGHLGKRKVELMRLRADYYKTFRQDHKSDAGLDRAWELTDDGLELMEIREKMKSIEHKLSAIRTLIDVCNLESRNQY